MPKKANHFRSGSVEINRAPGHGEGATRRLSINADRLVTQPIQGVDTIYDVIRYAARTHGSRNALGWRDVVSIHEEAKEVTKTVNGKETTETKTWKYFELSDYKYLSFIEVEEAISEVARALVDLGVTTDHVFNVFAQTSVNWQIMANACGSASIAVATAYDTLGDDGLAHSLNEPECIGIFTNAELLPSLLRVLGKTPTVKYVVYDGEPDASVLDKLRNLRSDIKTFSVGELREIGKAKSVDTLDSRRPTGETSAYIMYTSGSTGPPKGVCITHANLIASVGAVYTMLGHHLGYDDDYLAYLPLAHILECIVELTAYFIGVTIGYGRAKTLTDSSVRNCKGDISTFRPSVMVGVPAVWETIRKGIEGKVKAGGYVKKALFDGAIAAKKMQIPILGQLAHSVILSGVRAATGGRLRLALSGGAAVSRETQEFLSVALVNLLQGYGMTESCGMCVILPPEFMQYSAAGLPVPSVEIKLLDVVEANYLSSNTPPQGEVCIRGPSVSKEYYKRPDLNADESIFTKDGWMRTGDIAQWNKDGTLTIIDRVKNLVKLQSGEYIALEQLESTYRACKLVNNICVHATPNATQPIAIIIPHEANLRHALEASKVADHTSSLEDLCKDPKVSELVVKECNAVGKKNGFKPIQMLHAVILTAEEWTPENGLVTAAQKIQRSKIAKVFEKEIKSSLT